MSFQEPLSPELEAQAQELVARLRPQAEEDLLALARLLVSKEDHELFGETEFEVRDLVHRLGAKAYSAHVAGGKRGRKVRAAAARTVSKAPKSTATGTKQPRAGWGGGNASGAITNAAAAAKACCRGMKRSG